MGKKRIHIIDDEPIIQDIIRRLLKDEDYDIEISSTHAEAIEKHKKKEFDLILLDLMIPGSSGLSIYREILRYQDSPKVLILTAYGDYETIKKAEEMGAIGYIPKPFDNEKLYSKIKSILEGDEEKEGFEGAQSEIPVYSGIVGKSEKMRRVFKIIDKISKTNSTVLIEGESGTGKELIARAIHMKSKRSGKPFIVVQSAPTELFESHLFGHKKGAFTGAVSDKKGLVEKAEGGTLFLDEISSVNLQTQAKLLRLIQEQEYMRLGDSETRKSNVRFIAATNVSLSELVSEGKFREDLYFRLNVIKIKVPPLRERREDIPLLVDYFIKKYNITHGREIKGVDDKVLQVFMKFEWPGNVRQLENAIERMVILAEDSYLKVDDIPDDILYGDKGEGNHSIFELDGKSLKSKVKEFERILILKALKEAGGVQKKAAELLKIKPTTLNEMMKRLGINGKTN